MSLISLSACIATARPGDCPPAFAVIRAWQAARLCRCTVKTNVQTML